MTSAEIIQLEETFQIPTYNKLPLALVRGEGSYVWDADGQRYLDFYGGHCVTLLGHCPPRVVQAIQAQAAELLFYSNVVHSPIRAKTAALLAEVAPKGLGHVFFCNSGTEANETALKLARKWTGKSGVIAMKGGFHGRSLGSLATTWNEKYRAPYASVLPPTHFIPFGNLDELSSTLEADPDIAAVIVEPIQSMAGITEAPANYFQGMRALCDRHSVALIFDEVQTGVGRTGTFSISEQYGMVPDLISLAKSLGSGVPVGAVLTSDAIAASVEYGDQGSTFGGGMLAMAAVHATMETILEDNLLDRATSIHDQIQEAIGPFVNNVRGRGCLLGLELDRPAKPVLTALRESGVLAGGSGDPNVIRLMPPLTASDEEVSLFADAFAQVVKSTTSQPV